MTVRVIGRAALDAWVDALITKQRVYGVQAKEERFAFGQLESAADLRLDYDVTTLPPKKYFLPQREVLSEFNRYDMTFESVTEAEPFVVFGVHPYDVEAIRQLDKIFERGNPDVHYLTRREAATVVALDAEKPSEHVFAGSMGTAVGADVEGHDLLVTRIGDDAWVIEAKTEKGEALLASLGETAVASETDLAARTEVWKSNRKALNKHKLAMSPLDLPALLEKSKGHPVWAEKAELCFSCGSCNLVCPTCYCFDVEDELDWNMETGKRTRKWDACMLTRFAEVAGEHNFRSAKAARYRHRYYRKGKYTFDMTGDISCVGCGRCISACTANIANPVEVFNRLLETV